MDIPNDYKLIKNVYKILKKVGQSDFEDDNELSLLPSYVKICTTGDIYTNKSKINSYIEQPKIFYVNQDIVDYMDLKNKEEVKQFKKKFGLLENMRFDDDVKNIDYIFQGDFNENISNLNLDKVESMHGLFRNNKSFNQNISKWNVGNAINMRKIFKDTSFNGDISLWNVSNVEYLAGAFRNSKFNQDISKWDVGKVKSMIYVFTDSSFNQDISGWNVENVTHMRYMFRNSPFNQDISGWDVRKVIDFKGMFDGTPMEGTVPKEYFTILKDKDISVSTIKNLTQSDINYISGEGLDPLSIIELEKKFGKIEYWEFDNVTNLSTLFYDSILNPNISDWDVGNIIKMNSLFKNSNFNQDISGWNVENVTNMRVMFKNSPFNQDISGWDVRKVEDFKGMFDGTPMEGTVPEEYFTVLKDKGSSTKDKGSSTKIKLTHSNIINIYNIDNQLSKLEKKFGRIEEWKFDDSVNNLEYLFRNSILNQDISKWDVSRVVNMQAMFKNSEFNKDISQWDVRKVKNMIEMFKDSQFNQDISKWIVSNVTNMYSMFRDSLFNQDISKWDVSNVVNMNSMFKYSMFNQDISGWDVRLVEDFTDMFKGSPMEGTIPEEYFTVLKDEPSLSTTKKITQNDIFVIMNDSNSIDNQLSKLEKKFGEIEDWKFDDDVYDFYSLFMGSVSNDDISNWNVSKIETMSHMFEGNTFFNQDISNWNVGKVENMNSMFESTNFNQDISKWNVGNVRNMSNMFKDSKFNQDISGWNVRKDVNFTDMFKGSPMEGIVPEEYFTVLKDPLSIQVSPTPEIFYMYQYDIDENVIIPLENENLEKFKKDFGLFENMRLANDVKDIGYIFSDNFNQNISNLNVDKVEKMNYTFKDNKIFNQDISKWNVGNVIKMRSMFKNSTFNGDISSWNVGNVETLSGAFHGSQFNQNISKWNVGKVKLMGSVFEDSQFNQDISGWDVSNVTTMMNMFKNSPFNQDISGWNVRKVENFTDMFKGTPMEGTVPEKYFTVLKVSPTSKIFYLNQLDIDEGINIPIEEEEDLEKFKKDFGLFENMRLANDVKDISFLFSGNFNQNISNLNVDKVEDMTATFKDNKIFNQDISKWNVGNVNNMRSMFQDSGFNGDISSWNVSNVKKMITLFKDSQFNQDISSWNVKNVTHMTSMFYNSPFNQDISGWDVSNVTTMKYMFMNSPFNQDISGWDVRKVTSFQNMFTGTPMEGTVPEKYFTVLKDEESSQSTTKTDSDLKVGDVKAVYYEPTKSFYYVQIIPNEPSVKSPSYKWFIVIESDIDDRPVGWKYYAPNFKFGRTYLGSKTEEELKKLHQDYLKKPIPPTVSKNLISNMNLIDFKKKYNTYLLIDKNNNLDWNLTSKVFEQLKLDTTIIIGELIGLTVSEKIKITEKLNEDGNINVIWWNIYDNDILNGGDEYLDFAFVTNPFYLKDSSLFSSINYKGNIKYDLIKCKNDPFELEKETERDILFLSYNLVLKILLTDIFTNIYSKESQYVKSDDNPLYFITNKVPEGSFNHYHYLFFQVIEFICDFLNSSDRKKIKKFNKKCEKLLNEIFISPHKFIIDEYLSPFYNPSLGENGSIDFVSLFKKVGTSSDFHSLFLNVYKLNGKTEEKKEYILWTYISVYIEVFPYSTIKYENLYYPFEYEKLSGYDNAYYISLPNYITDKSLILTTKPNKINNFMNYPVFLAESNHSKHNDLLSSINFTPFLQQYSAFNSKDNMLIYEYLYLKRVSMIEKNNLFYLEIIWQGKYSQKQMEPSKMTLKYNMDDPKYEQIKKFLINYEKIQKI